MSGRWWFAACVCVFASCASDEPAPERPSRAACEQVVAKLVELEVAAQSTHAGSADDEVNEAHRAQLAAAVLTDGRDVSRCESEYSGAAVACVLAAADLGAARACTAR